MMTARENMNKAARIMWSAVSSKNGSLPHILRKPSEDYSQKKNLETVFALRLCLELRWELRLFPIIRYKVGVVLCWCWRCWMEVSGQHGYPSFGLLGIIWFQVTLSSKFSHFKWLFLTLIVWVLIWRFGLSPEMTSVVILTEDVDFWLGLVKSVCILCLA